MDDWPDTRSEDSLRVWFALTYPDVLAGTLEYVMASLIYGHFDFERALYILRMQQYTAEAEARGADA